MSISKITARGIEALRKQAIREQRDLFLWDTVLRGLGVKATANGHVSWLVQKWQGGRGGKAQRIVVGSCPPMDLDQARRQAGISIGDVHKGADLVGRRKQQRQTKREALHAVTLGEAWARYFKKASTPGRYWSELQTRIDNEVVPKFGKDTKLANITKHEIRSLIEAKEDNYPGAARTLYVALAPFFKWCVERDLIPVSPMATLPRPEPAPVRDRLLSDAEIKTFWKATGDLFVFGPFYRLLLLTAQRREEVGAMQWSEIDLDAGTWTIPKERTKNSKEHLVHLSPQAVAILKALPKLDSPFVFTTTLTSPISGYGKAKIKLDELMQAQLGKKKLQPWRVHDLRRTAASGMAKLGFQPHIVERVLNHISGAQGGLVGVYQRYEYADERKKALLAWGNAVENLVAETKTAPNVVPFRG